MKVCSSCSVSQATEEFGHRAASPDGLQPKCKTCTKAYNASWYSANRESHNAKQAVIHTLNRPHRLEQMRQRHQSNPDYVVLAARKHRKTHPDKVNARHAAYRASRLQCTPRWADFSVIDQLYEEAHRITVQTGIKHEVDHFIPLRSKLVCGLHVQQNLRIITKVENARKGNKIIEDTQWV